MKIRELDREAEVTLPEKTRYEPILFKRGASQSIRQSICAVCGKVALPGSAIVREFGGGGRVHQHCAK